MTTKPPRQQLGAAIKDALEERGESQSWLGREVGRILGRPDPYSQAIVSTWVLGDRLPEPAQVFAIEQALGLRPGFLSRHLGYLPVDHRPAVTVEDAVETDVDLTPSQRGPLLDHYRGLVEATRARRDAEQKRRKRRTR